MKLTLFLALACCCLLLSTPSHAGLIGSILYPVVNFAQPFTSAIIDSYVGQLLATFGTTLDKIQSTVTEPLEALLNETLTDINNDAEGLLEFLGLVEKAKTATAPPISFNCPNTNFQTAGGPPKSINNVRIGDIKYIGLLGDSVAAGLGTIGNTLLSATTFQGRGYCSKAGGAGDCDHGNTTVPNIMRDLFQNTGLNGYSSAEGDCQDTLPCSNLNVANLASFHPMYPAQAISLVKKILLGNTYKYNDWKIIHIFYGVNDLCLLCTPDHYSDIAMMGLDMRITIAILKLFLPNTFIYAHIPYDLRPLKDLATDNIGCKTFQTAICPCAVLGSPDQLRANQLAIANVWHNIAMEVNSPTSNFHISEIKHLTDTQPPKDANGNYQYEILSGNCVHPSRAAHYIHGRNVIKEMFISPDLRPLFADYSVLPMGSTFDIMCPPGDGYLKTYYN